MGRWSDLGSRCEPRKVVGVAADDGHGGYVRHLVGVALDDEGGEFAE
jgi:hypothetical protein